MADTSGAIKSKSRSCLLLVGSLVLPIALAVIAQRLLFAGLDAPPTDFGTGHMFDLIATRYDAINRVLAIGMDVGWRRQMVQKIHDSLNTASLSDDNNSKPRILDLATGTADVALMLRKEIPQATVIGIDPSHKMLAVGRQKVQRAGFEESISLTQADAQDLLASLEPSSFDAATMAFGIRNVPNRQKALCQIHAVLKDQARFCVLEFSEPDESFGMMGVITRWFIRYLVPLIGGILSGAPREYWHLQNSIKDFPTPQEFGQFLENLDCQTGTFRLEELIQISFGAVQLYVTKVLKETAAAGSSSSSSSSSSDSASVEA